MTHRRILVAGSLSLALLAAACHEDELFSPPPAAYKGGALFKRYVAIGNSITAGWQSGGINDSLQRLAYPVLVAGAMGGDPFYYPSLNAPGCPPPYTNIFTGARVGSGTGTTCAFRNANIPPYLNNLGVPYAFAADPPRNGGPITPINPLVELILGGRTQVELMTAARPTFVSVWIGNNDLLIPAGDPANAGDTTKLTPLAAYKADYRSILDAIEAVDAKAILIGVVNVTAIPFFAQGQTYFGIKNTTTNFPTNFLVANNCGPRGFAGVGVGDSVLVPFPYGLGLIGLAQADPANNYTLDCSVPQVIVPRELLLFAQAADSFNAFDSTEAATRGWAWINPNPTLDSLLAVPGQVAPFPNTAVTCSGSPFGLALSCDGVHPSTATQRLIARKLVQAINAKYVSAIPAVPAVP